MFIFENFRPVATIPIFMIVFAPILLAFLRNHGSRWAIFVTWLLFAWTGIGWMICFIWSLTGRHPDREES